MRAGWSLCRSLIGAKKIRWYLIKPSFSVFTPINWHSSTANDDDNDGKLAKPVFLHVGPSGDCWTGSSIFAAKHLQPDYVKSIPLIPPHNDICVETLVEMLEENGKMAQEMYDDGVLSEDLLEQVRSVMKEQEEEDA